MKIKKYKLYLIDLDGTLYNGNNEIKYAKEFIDFLNYNNIDYLLITNNSTTVEKDVVKKLKNFDIVTKENNILTSSEATSLYIKSNKLDNVYVIGEVGIKETLVRNNINIVNNSDLAEVVVVGLDRNVTYDKLSIACQAILNGAKFIATNPDKLIPTEKGMFPSNGAQVKFLEYATSIEPIIIGKPNNIIMNVAIEKFDYNLEDIVMIGDNYDTDIMSGANIGIDTIHVQTGVTSKEELKTKAIQPTYTVENLKNLFEDNI